MTVLLCADSCGAYVLIRGASVDSCEDAGLEVLEDQSEDYVGMSASELDDVDVVTLTQVKTFSDYTPFP